MNSYERTLRWCRAQARGWSLRGDVTSGLAPSLTFAGVTRTTALGSIQSLGAGRQASSLAETRAAASAGGLSHTLASRAGPVPAPEPSFAPPPAVIGARFEVLHAIPGGMGVVTFCFDHEAGVPFAIKTYREELFQSRPQVLAAFFREMELWVRCGAHPHIVRAYGTRQVAGRPYLFLELVPGQTCRELLAEGRLGTSEVAALGVMVCDALLHARWRVRGFVHGDLKLSNLLVHEGRVRVTDFGVACAGKALRSRGGTPRSMAPEQWLRRPLSAKTDVYGLGVVLCQLWTGSPPFSGQDVRRLRHAHTRQLPLWLGLCGEDPRLSSLLLRCLAKDPAARPGLRALRRALRALVRPERCARIRPPRSRLALLVSGWRRWCGERDARRVLEFGRRYEGGLDAAVRDRLDALDTRTIPAREVWAELLSLSGLRRAFPGAFEGWSAARLDFGPLDLRGRKLGALFLPGGRLTRMDLRGADLRGASLAGARFEDSLLHYADLRGADLRGADLRRADLRRTDLRGCQLQGARLEGVDLRGSRLEGARLDGFRCDFRTHLDPSALPHLLEVFKGARGAARWSLLEQVVQVGGDPRVARLLLAGLHDPDPEIRRRSAIGLGRIGEAAQVVAPGLVAMATTAGSDPALRLLALRALGALAPLSARAGWRLIRCLKEPDPALQAAVAEALGRGRPRIPELPRALAQLLDADEPVSVAAARALGRLGGGASDVAWDLEWAAESGAPRLRRAAARALERVRTAPAERRPGSFRG